MGIWGELAASVSMVRGVAGREDGSGVSVMEFFLESEGGAFTLDTKGGRKERGREGDHSKDSSPKTRMNIAYLKALVVLGLH